MSAVDVLNARSDLVLGALEQNIKELSKEFDDTYEKVRRIIKLKISARKKLE